jgi:hypothetical protein
VNDLVVDSHLHTIVVDDEDADAATAVVERLCETTEETALVKDGKALLDITRLGHGDNATVLADVENTVLLEDRTKHVLDNDGWGRVGDEAGLLMELLGEQVNTEVTVLASLGGGGDADDLARAALKDQEVANADVVAGDGDVGGGRHLASCSRGRCWDESGGFEGRARATCGSRGRSRGRSRGERSLSRSWSSGEAGTVCRRRASDGCGGRGDANDLLYRSSGLDGVGWGFGGSSSSVLLLDDYVFTVVVVLSAGEGLLLRVLVTVRVDGVLNAIGDLVGCLGDSLTKRVVLTFVVVISHITPKLLRGGGSGRSSFFYSSLSWVTVVNVLSLPPVGVGVVFGSERFLLRVAGTGDDGTGVLAELTFGDVDLRRLVVGGRAVDSVEVTIVCPVLYLDLRVGVG